MPANRNRDYTVREFPFSDELHITELINTEIARLSSNPLNHFARNPDISVKVVAVAVNPGFGLVVIFEREETRVGNKHELKDGAVFQSETNRRLEAIEAQLGIKPTADTDEEQPMLPGTEQEPATTTQE